MNWEDIISAAMVVSLVVLMVIFMYVVLIGLEIL